MSIIDDILGKHKAVIEQLSQKFGISPDQAMQVLSQVMPRLRSGILEKIGIGGGESLAPVVAQIRADLAKSLATVDPNDDDATNKARGFLGTALPDDEQERTTNEIAKSAGLSPDLVRQILPHAAILTARDLDADGALGPSGETKKASGGPKTS